MPYRVRGDRAGQIKETEEGQTKNDQPYSTYSRPSVTLPTSRSNIIRRMKDSLYRNFIRRHLAEQLLVRQTAVAGEGEDLSGVRLH